MSYSTHILKCVLVIIAVFSVGCSSSVRFSSSKEKKETGKTYENESIQTDKPAVSKTESYTENYQEISDLRRKILQEAERWLGTPYCWGGNTYQCTDCSGFVINVFKAVGIELPRTSQEQFVFSDKLDDANKLPGDLVFFKSGNRINHVGIFIGSYSFIHASTSQGVIKTSLFDNYYNSRFVGYGRVIK